MIVKTDAALNNRNKSKARGPDASFDYRHDCSECRSVERFKVGQNLYQSFNTREVGPNWRKAIDSWFTEIDQFPVSSVSGYRFNHKTGHYSQMVWGATTRIGCGAILYRCGQYLINRFFIFYFSNGMSLVRNVGLYLISM